MNKIEELAFIADRLDSQGLHREAGLIDRFLYRQAFVFSIFEKEAVKSLIRALTVLEPHSLISNPTVEVKLPPFPGLPRGRKATGTVAQRYVAILEWLNVFITEILEPNLKYQEDNEYYQTLVEYTKQYARDALNQLYTIFASIENEYDLLKKDADRLATRLNIISANPKSDDAIRDKFEEIKKEFYDIVVDLNTYLKKGNIDLTQLKDIVETTKGKLKNFLKDQKGKRADDLKSFFENGDLIYLNTKGPTFIEEDRDIDWYRKKARGSGDPRLMDLADSYKDMAARRNNTRKSREKQRRKLEGIHDTLEMFYGDFSEAHQGNGEALKGLSEVLKEDEKQLLLEQMNRLLQPLKRASLSKKAQEDFEMEDLEALPAEPTSVYPELAQIKRLAVRAERVMKELKLINRRYESAVQEEIQTAQLLRSTIEKAMLSKQIKRIDWDLFEKEVEDTIERVDRRVKFVSDKNDKAKDFLKTNFDGYKKVLEVLKI